MITIGYWAHFWFGCQFDCDPHINGPEGVLRQRPCEWIGGAILEAELGQRARGIHLDTNGGGPGIWLTALGHQHGSIGQLVVPVVVDQASVAQQRAESLIRLTNRLDLKFPALWAESGPLAAGETQWWVSPVPCIRV
jgi:hypothetical protein